MNRLLMLGSSHAACFSGLQHDQQHSSLAIFANRGGGICRNLQFAEDGTFSLAEKAADFDRKIFEFSGQDSSRNLHDYTHVIINILSHLNLPLLFHGDRSKSGIEHSIFTATDALQQCIYEYCFSHRSTLDSLALINTIADLGFPRERILMLAVPFSCLHPKLAQSGFENSPALAAKITHILTKLTETAKENFKINLLLPDGDMLHSGLFLRPHYSTRDSTCNWRNALAGESIYAAGREHKNRLYAEAMMTKIAAWLAL
jgi:hypothetical protein